MAAPSSFPRSKPVPSSSKSSLLALESLGALASSCLRGGNNIYAHLYCTVEIPRNADSFFPFFLVSLINLETFMFGYTQQPSSLTSLFLSALSL